MAKSLQASRIRSVGRTSHAPNPGSHISIHSELGMQNAATLVGRGVEVAVTDLEARWLGKSLIEYAVVNRTLGASRDWITERENRRTIDAAFDTLFATLEALATE